MLRKTDKYDVIVYYFSAIKRLDFAFKRRYDPAFYNKIFNKKNKFRFTSQWVILLKSAVATGITRKARQKTRQLLEGLNVRSK